jgi:RNA polymerase sigma-70 factor (ECF subfamily)
MLKVVAMPTDLELIEKYQKNADTAAMGQLFERYSHLVFGVCMKLLADSDQAQESVSQIFEKLFESLKTAEIKFFPAWIHQVSKNHCLQLLNKKNKIKQPLDQDVAFEENFLSWEKTVEQTQIESLPEALAQLGESQRICIELFYLKELSYKEIQTKTGFSFAEVKSHIQNGKRNLKIILTQKSKSYER